MKNCFSFFYYFLLFFSCRSTIYHEMECQKNSNQINTFSQPINCNLLNNHSNNFISFVKVTKDKISLCNVYRSEFYSAGTFLMQKIKTSNDTLFIKIIHAVLPLPFNLHKTIKIKKYNYISFCGNVYSINLIPKYKDIGECIFCHPILIPKEYH